MSFSALNLANAGESALKIYGDDYNLNSLLKKDPLFEL